MTICSAMIASDDLANRNINACEVHLKIDESVYSITLNSDHLNKSNNRREGVISITPGKEVALSTYRCLRFCSLQLHVND